MVRGELGKQNRRRCSITVLEGLRGEFTRDTGKSTKRGKSGQTLDALYGSSVPVLAYGKTKIPC